MLINGGGRVLPIPRAMLRPLETGRPNVPRGLEYRRPRLPSAKGPRKISPGADRGKRSELQSLSNIVQARWQLRIVDLQVLNPGRGKRYQPDNCDEIGPTQVAPQTRQTAPSPFRQVCAWRKESN